MNECKVCGKECNGSTCSGSCRAKLQRRTRTQETEQAHAQLEGVKVYGRQAVLCDQFKTRPEPLDITDKPVPLNRGRYVTKDNEVYQFDAVGNVFRCEQGLVYATLSDVRQARGIQ